MAKKGILSIVKEYGGRLGAFIRSRVSSDEDAEDILQDVWFQLSQLINLEEIESISGWLFSVSRNKIADGFKKKKAEPQDDLEELDQLRFDLPELPDDVYFRNLFWEELMDALEELPDKQRDTFISNELDGHTLQSIADNTGENLKTVISRKRYATQHLRTKLRDLYEDLDNY